MQLGETSRGSEGARRPQSVDPQRSYELEATEPLSDEELVRACLEGDQDAWNALIDKYRNLIFSIPCKKQFSPEDAAEIFQEVCVRLLWALPHIRQPRTLAAWLIRVTSNECVQWRRKQSRRRNLPAEEERFYAGPGSDLTESVVGDLEREQMLREAIASLANRCRELVEMLFFTIPPVPYEQVAKRLGLAKGSIGFIRGRCLKRLRRLLNERGFTA